MQKVGVNVPVLTAKALISLALALKSALALTRLPLPYTFFVVPSDVTQW